MGELNKFLILFCLVFLSLSLAVSVARGIETGDRLIEVMTVNIHYHTGENLYINYGTGETLIHIENGTLITPDAQIRVEPSYGSIYFTNTLNNTLKFDSTYKTPNYKYVFMVDGGSIISHSSDYSEAFIRFTTTGAKGITWDIVPSGLVPYVNPLPNFLGYTIDFIGVFGITLMIISPVYVIRRFKQEGLTQESFEALGWGALMLLIGFGLALTWITW